MNFKFVIIPAVITIVSVNLDKLCAEREECDMTMSV